MSRDSTGSAKWLAWIPPRGRVAAAAVGVLLLVLMVRGCGPRSGTGTWFSIEPREYVGRFVEKGVLEPSRMIPVYGTMEGPLAKVPRDGLPVEAGDLLFVVDEQELDETLEEDEERVQELEMNLDIEERNYQLLMSTYEAKKVREAAVLKNAQILEREGLIALTPAEQRQKEIEIELARLDLEDAREALERQEQLVEKGFAAPTRLDPLQRDVESAETYLKELQTNLDILLEGPTEEEIRTLRTAVTQAQAVVDRSQTRHDRELHASQLKIDSLKHDLAFARDRLDQNLELKHQTQILASTSGVVRLRTKMNWGTGRRLPLSIGQTVYDKDVLADIIDPSTMQISLLIHESDIPGIVPGLSAEITLAAYPSVMFTGEVIRVSQLGQDRSDLAPEGSSAAPSRQTQFKALVDFDADGLQVRPGMTATVSMTRTALTDRLLIPRAAILHHGDKAWVQRKGDRKPVAITGEIIDDLWFLVADGLEAGDVIRARAEEGAVP